MIVRDYDCIGLSSQLNYLIKHRIKSHVSDKHLLTQLKLMSSNLMRAHLKQVILNTKLM